MKGAFLLLVMLTGCSAGLPAHYQPLGFSSYGRLPSGERVRLYTDYASGTTTGKVGDKSVRFKSYLPPEEEEEAPE